MMFTLLLLSLLHITTCTVYTVTPDDDPHCHNLQHYLLSTTKYFTSNTQLLFLPGIHHLHTDLIIQNVHNISLIGNTHGTTQDVVIQCNEVGVLMVNITNLVINNMIYRECTVNNHFGEYQYVYLKNKLAALVFEDCNFVNVNYLKVSCNYLILVNVLGNSYFDHLTCDGIKLFYFEVEQVERKVSTISINHYQSTNDSTPLEFKALQDSYKIIIELANIKITLPDYSYVFNGDIGKSEVIIANSKFTYKSISFSDQCISLFYFYSSRNGKVHFTNCHFLTNHKVAWAPEFALIITEYKITLNITDCSFTSFNSPILTVYRENDDTMLATVVIQSTTISSSTMMLNRETDYIIMVSNTRLLLTGTVIFHNNTVLNSVILLTDKSDLVVDGKLQFSNNSALSIIDFHHNTHEYIMIKETSIVDIITNYLDAYITTSSVYKDNPYPYCFFQYISSKNLDNNIQHGKFLIKFYYNYYNHTLRMPNHILQNMPTTNCQWLPQSSFNTTLPLDVNNEYIQYTDSTGTYNTLPHVNEPNTLCVCTNISHYDCSITDLGFVYPGQTLTIPLYHYTEKYNSNAIISVVNQPNIPLCRVLDGNQHKHTLDNQSQCTIVNYTIAFPTSGWCELFLKTVIPASNHANLFTVRQRTCPKGFANIDGICQCHTMLKKIGITQCNINDQTVLRPSNGWIVTASDNSEFYLASSIVHSTIVFLTHHILTYQILTHNVNSTGVESCADNVNMVSVLYLVPLIVNTAPTLIFY